LAPDIFRALDAVAHEVLFELLEGHDGHGQRIEKIEQLYYLRLQEVCFSLLEHSVPLVDEYSLLKTPWVGAEDSTAALLSIRALDLFTNFILEQDDGIKIRLLTDALALEKLCAGLLALLHLLVVSILMI
jgi:hypothetical protein